MTGQDDEPKRGDRRGSEPDKHDEDAALFAQAMADVRPLQYEPRARLATPRRAAPKPADPASRPQLDPGPATPVTGDAFVSYRAPGVQERVYRRLKRGQPAPRQQLDLHGLTVAQAEQALLALLAEPGDSHCLLVIHGKSHGRAGQPAILKSQVVHWLQQHPRVNALVSAPTQWGGTGALLVLLRRQFATDNES